MVVSKSGQVLITYRVIKEENGWKVYDVVIEGVSLVSNYRTQFREILGNNPPRSCLIPSVRGKPGNSIGNTSVGRGSSASKENDREESRSSLFVAEPGFREYMKSRGERE